jgi:tetratricopeptide (TPR) repeat protein
MLINANKPKSAMEQFERVQRANSNYPELSYQWAVAKKKVAEQENSKDTALEAIKLAKKELAKNPVHFESYLLIAELYYILGSLSKSKTEGIGQQDVAYSGAYSEMVSWFKLCAKNYQKAIDLAVQPGGVFIDMAKCYRLSGSLDQARASAAMAEDLDKTNPRIWIETAQIYEQQGNYRAAVKAYENFQTIYPNAPNKKEVENKINSLKSIVEEN